MRPEPNDPRADTGPWAEGWGPLMLVMPLAEIPRVCKTGQKADKQLIKEFENLISVLSVQHRVHRGVLLPGEKKQMVSLCRF